MRVLLLLVCALGAGLAPQSAAAEGCDLVVAAFVKASAVPWHATVEAHGSQTLTMEIVTLGAISYSRKNSDDWQTHKVSDAGPERIHRDWAQSNCVPDGSEAFGDDIADIVRRRAMGEVGVSNRFWVSRATGYLLKSELKAGRDVVTTLYDYSDVKAPPGLAPSP
jgi:hypothetical protein